MKVKKLFLGAAFASSAALVLGSCGSKTLALNVCLASTPDHVDPALNSAVDGASYAVHLFGGLVRYVPDGNGGLKLAADLAEEIPTKVPENGGKVKYTFKIRSDAKFSDGSAIQPSDFVKSWNRAASYTPEGSDVEGATDADYCYMFEVIDGYDSLKEKAEAGTLTAADYKNFLNVQADDTAKTLTVTLAADVPYFYELCAFPAYMVLKNADTLDTTGAWAKNPEGFVSSGSYVLDSFEKDVSMKIKKNDNYWDATNVKQNEVTFVFSDDESAQLASYETEELLLIDSLDSATVTAKKNAADYHVIGQLGTYYIAWNINSDLFPRKTEAQKQEIRQAISLLIDRNKIVNQVTKCGETPSTGFVGAGLTDPAGGEFVNHNGVNEDGSGWTGNANDVAANRAKAVEILDKYFNKGSDGKYTDFPTLPYLINNGSNHTAIATELKAELANYGINITVDSQEWSVFLNTRKQGNYTIARNGWLADYNDPISFLDLWTTGSGNNDCQFGKGDAANVDIYSIDCSSITGYTNLSGTWADTYDKLIGDIKLEANTEARYKLMHKAETLLMSTGCITPIYNYVDNWLQNEKLTNVYASPLGFKYFMWSELK